MPGGFTLSARPKSGVHLRDERRATDQATFVGEKSAYCGDRETWHCRGGLTRPICYFNMVRVGRMVDCQSGQSAADWQGTRLCRRRAQLLERLAIGYGVHPQFLLVVKNAGQSGDISVVVILAVNLVECTEQLVICVSQTTWLVSSRCSRDLMSQVAGRG